MERQGAIALVLRRRDLCRQWKNDSGRTTVRTPRATRSCRAPG